MDEEERTFHKFLLKFQDQFSDQDMHRRLLKSAVKDQIRSYKDLFNWTRDRYPILNLRKVQTIWSRYLEWVEEEPS